MSVVAHNEVDEVHEDEKDGHGDGAKRHKRYSADVVESLERTL
eukprot:CAMPEP_0171772288 /NCGR_PEP_ID=MMETSP0991-20121206/54606_1 /TAXON_ID=483369 /ORGANISM="non described non described, Strain CCMP2098" /LENGTH=42 /DNA_ID= /DNA_START= /DNA_END= /DNA_ORIENTATION=